MLTLFSTKFPCSLQIISLYRSGEDDIITNVLNTFDIYIMAVFNVDGFVFSHSDVSCETNVWDEWDDVWVNSGGSSTQNFLNFVQFLWKILKNRRLPPPPTGNPGSTLGEVIIKTHLNHYSDKCSAITLQYIIETYLKVEFDFLRTDFGEKQEVLMLEVIASVVIRTGTLTLILEVRFRSSSMCQTSLVTLRTYHCSTSW